MSTPAKSGRGKKLGIAAGVVIIIVVVAAYFAFGMGSTTAKSSVSIASGTGASSSLNFAPSSLTVILGKNNVIVFTNNDNVEHTVVFTSAPSGVSLTQISDTNLAPGSTFTVTLPVAGTYQYHCTIHAWMQGTITVNSA